MFGSFVAHIRGGSRPGGLGFLQGGGGGGATRNRQEWSIFGDFCLGLGFKEIFPGGAARASTLKLAVC